VARPVNCVSSHLTIETDFTNINLEETTRHEHVVRLKDFEQFSNIAIITA
jgi:hypothetical protein